jgi:hypothetical protein
MKNLLNVVCMLVVFASLLACKSKDHEAAVVRAESTPAASSAPEVKRKTHGEALAEIESLVGAIEYVKPHCEDTADEHSTGTLLLTLWGKDKLRAKDIKALPEVSYAAAMKDSEEARGKHLCGTGKVLQISKSASPVWEGKKVWEGLLILPGMRIVKYIAVGETGAIVEDSTATFCGVVTGKYQYQKAGGGFAHSLALVGIFTSYQP